MAEPPAGLARVLSKPDKARAFAGAVLDAATAVNRQDGIRVFRMALAGAIVELRFASPVLERLFMPSFGHLQSADGSPDLVVTLWDRSAGQDPPPLPWTPDEYRACGEVAGYSEGERYVQADVPLAALTVLDLQTSHAVYWNGAPEKLPTYDFASPLRTLLHRWYIERSKVIAHAGAVSTHGGAALLVGDRGAGKTTTSIACVEAGLSYIGDDRCMVVDGFPPQVHHIYSCAKIFINEVERFSIPGLREATLLPARKSEPKAVVYMDRLRPTRIEASANLKCVIAPSRIDGTLSRLVPIPPSTALRLLVADAFGRSPSTAVRSLTVLRGICAKLPCYRLEAGTDFARIAETVAAGIGN